MNYQKLFNWYQKHHRKLPFRETKDPYQIWVSEIMLQQTQVERVLLYYEKFLQQFPTIQALFKASIEEILQTIAGIGYYRRFRNLKKGAAYLMKHHQGVFPQTYDEIIKIPGIGQYTAGAIMSICFNEAYPATDGNVMRVLSRFYALGNDFRFDSNKRKLNTINQRLITESQYPHDYTQSMMEL